jgi:chitin disaccharide deacetylase
MTFAKRLIVNADDYGMTPAVSAGIRRAHLNGIVTSATTMMNLPAAKDSLALLHDMASTLAVGVHLVLSAGSPLRPPDTVRSLVTNTGTFMVIRDLYEQLATIDSAELRDEWRLQIETFLESGLPIDHIDSHHHISYFHPTLFEVMLTLVQEYGVPIRSPFLGAEIPAFVSELLTAYPVRYPDRLDISFYDTGATHTHFVELVENLPDGVTEFMTHPGEVDAELRAMDSYTDPRIRELDILTDPQVKALIESCQIELISFAQL